MKKPILITSKNFEKLNQLLRFYNIGDYAYIDPDCGEYGIIQIVKGSKIICIKHWYEFILFDLYPLMEKESYISNKLDIGTFGYNKLVENLYTMWKSQQITN